MKVMPSASSARRNGVFAEEAEAGMDRFRAAGRTASTILSFAE